MTSTNSKLSSKLILILIGSGILLVGGFLFFRCRSDVSGLSYCSTLGLVNAGAFKDRGIERMKKGDDEGAIADFERAIEINPKEADAFYNMGLIKGEIRDYKSALTFMNKADAIRPNEKYKRRIGEYKSEIERLERERLERERLESIENITADYNLVIQQLLHSHTNKRPLRSHIRNKKQKKLLRSRRS